MLFDWWAICPHVHCRDEEWRQKATIAEVFRLAHSQGIKMIFDMPNVFRPVIDRFRIWERLALVPPGERENYRLYIGLTGDESQILEALWCYDNIPEVIGLKMFAGRSVGNLSVIKEDSQRMVYRVLTQHGFQGVLAVHCEKEEAMNVKLWNPARPITHTWARSEVAEFASIADQAMFALSAGYQGRLHICHVSSPMSVRQVGLAKTHGLHISCGATPHHLMWDESKMTGADGLIYKMNPPLRSAVTVARLRQELVEGRIDCIETDHAPHTPEEKAPPLCLSGYPSLQLYRQFVTVFLPGLGLTEDAIKALTRDNILEIFSDKI